MPTRTAEQIKKEFDEVQHKIFLLSNDLVVLRNELNNLIEDTQSDIITKLDKKIIIFDKLAKYNENLTKFGMEKLKLIEEYNS